MTTTKCWLLFLAREEVDARLADPRARAQIEAIARRRQQENAAHGTEDALDTSPTQG